MKKLLLFSILLLATSSFAAETATKQLTITVNPTPATLVITTTTMPQAYVSLSYLSAVSATGGVAPYKWSIVGATLPPGLTLDATTGVISGTPTTTGTYSFTVQVTDSVGTTTAVQGAAVLK